MRVHILSTVAAVAALASTAAGAQVRATVTADNNYMLGWGPAGGPATWQAPVSNTNDANQIFSCGTGPEVYNFNPAVADYIYIAANGDKFKTQGVIARLALTGGQVVVSGSPGWQVLATGNDVPLSPAAANAALANPPAAWANPVTTLAPGLVFGEFNAPVSAQNPAPDLFLLVCNNAANLIPANARWMWYRAVQGMNPFNTNPPSGGGHGEFLIFRIPVRALMCTCTTRRFDPRDVRDEVIPRGLDIRAIPVDSTPPRPHP